MAVASHQAAGLLLLALLLGGCAELGMELETGAGGAAPRRPTAARAAQYELHVSTKPRSCPVAPALRRKGLRRIGVDVRLRRLGPAQVPANPYYARLVDGDGQVHEATLGDCGQALSPALPAEGETARGVIVFDVPSDARTFTFIYAPRIEGTLAEELSVALGR